MINDDDDDDVNLEGLYIFTGNDAISYFQLAANCVHTAAVVVVADFITTWTVWKIIETAKAGNFKIYQNVALDSIYVSTENDVVIYFRLAGNCINVFILVLVWVTMSW